MKIAILTLISLGIFRANRGKTDKRLKYLESPPILAFLRKTEEAPVYICDVIHFK
jgi:hypothetical protein